MKNILAENMLRFGPRNLSESAKRKLSKLAEQADSRSQYIAKLEQIDPAAAEFAKTPPETAQIKITNKHVISWVPTASTQGGGEIYIFKVGTSNGVPVIYQRFTAIDKQSSGSEPSDVIPTGIFKLTDFGKTISEQMNTIWNTLDSVKTQEVINAGIQFIKNNQQLFKTEFHKVTRSQGAIKLYWTDNPRKFAESQYALGFASKITDNAKVVLDNVQDDLLLQHIDFKVKNPRSNGAYPELKIPTAVI